MPASDPSRLPDGVRLHPEAMAQATEQFLGGRRLRNVVGVGYGVKWTAGSPTGQPALLVLVTHKVPAEALPEAETVPRALADGIPTDVVAVGPLMAQTSDVAGVAAVATDGVVPRLGMQGATRRMRPCPAGFSIGNVAITAGTLAGVVYDMLPGASVDPPASGTGIPSSYYLLSNNHVLADSNAAPLASAIVQPGRSDGGQDPQDRIGTLARFVPIEFAPQVPLEQQHNLVDGALAACQFQDATREIYFNGAPRGWRRASDVQVGDLVRKTGRTTSTTIGQVMAVDATVDVSYGSAGTARFTHQFVTTAMSAGGDSGSLITSLDNVAVGLLFAGSARVTIGNYFENVRSMLRIEIAEQVL